MSLLYIGTFGSFIGYSFALPLVIKTTFPEFLAHHAFIANYMAGLGFMGALIGSLSRPLGGWAADRLGGARLTLGCFLGMGAFTLIAIAGVKNHSFAEFFFAYMVIFFLAGFGNGTTYRMIPSIFSAMAQSEIDAGNGPEAVVLADCKRQTAAVIGIAGAVGAFGGFLIQVGFRQASLHVVALMTKATKAIPVADKVLLAKTKHAIALSHADWSIPALWVFMGGYVVLAATTWFFYVRKSVGVQHVPSLAHAAV
jgi:NNP family nitrate/nitrite transporter-like MFS transporter